MTLKKRDDDSAVTLLPPLDVFSALREARIFNDTPLSPRRARLLVGRILFLLYSLHSPFSRADATGLFFSATKLFLHKDPSLRQIVYLFLKELAQFADDTMMITSSLTRDINSKPDDFSTSIPTNAGFFSAAASIGLKFVAAATSASNSSQPTSAIGSSVCHRACALRTLIRITPPAMLGSVERFFKLGIVDKSAAVSSAALVSAILASFTSLELVRRWSNECHEAFTANKTLTTGLFSNFVQYHAVGLLYLIRVGDRMAVAKLIQSSCKPNTVRSSWALCMLIRYAVKCCQDETNAHVPPRNMTNVPGSLSSTMFDFLKTHCNGSEMVMLEAARGICLLVNETKTSITTQQASIAIQTLQMLLSSPKQALKFAALRTLNRLASIDASMVALCNVDMESLISDPNRSIATYAITTLLKTGTEQGVDRLMKQIITFMDEISDEFKIIVVDAIRLLAIKFPTKQAVLLSFLSSILREDGGYEYKRSVVEAIFSLVKSLPECLESALPHLCEFIEDCEFTKLAVRILYLIGSEAPKTKDPSKYIRYIYNRVILENSNVRAAAVNALAAIGSSLVQMQPLVKILLQRCLQDPDDEVRDRVVFNLKLFESRKDLVVNSTVTAIDALKAKIQSYLVCADFTRPFDAKQVPLISKEEFFTTIKREGSMLLSPSPKSSMSNLNTPTETPTLEIPELATIAGTHVKSSEQVDLTEKEMEYLVSCVKHVFKEHLVLEFIVKNTLEEIVLKDINVYTSEIDDCVKEFTISIPKLEYNETQRAFVCYKTGNACPIATVEAALFYKLCENDTEIQDRYDLEEIDVLAADYMVPSAVNDFEKLWDELGKDGQRIETYIVDFPSVQDAVNKFVSLLGMKPINGSDVVSNNVQESLAHVLLLSGIFKGGIKVLARMRMIQDSRGIIVEYAVRSESKISELLINSIQ